MLDSFFLSILTRQNARLQSLPLVGSAIFCFKIVLVCDSLKPEQEFFGLISLEKPIRGGLGGCAHPVDCKGGVM